MKFKAQRERWSKTTWYQGKKNGFKFNYAQKDNRWYCVISHTKKDIRFNSLWENLTFDTEEEIQKWCEMWDYKNHMCLGKDVD